MTVLSTERLDAIRARRAAATPGPWFASGPSPYGDDCTVTVGDDADELAVCPDCGTRGGMTAANALFVSHAPDDIEFLLGKVESLLAHNGVLVERAATTNVQARDLQGQLDKAREIHRPVNHRGIQVCNACTSLDVLMQTMSGRGRRGVGFPCPTARALGLGGEATDA